MILLLFLLLFSNRAHRRVLASFISNHSVNHPCPSSLLLLFSYPTVVDSEEGWQHKPWSGKLGSDSSSQTHEFLIKSPTPDTACSLFLFIPLSLFLFPSLSLSFSFLTNIELWQRIVIHSFMRIDCIALLQWAIFIVLDNLAAISNLDEFTNAIFHAFTSNWWRIWSDNYYLH